MEAWDDDSDYEVFDSLVDAANHFRGLVHGEKWVGVWREVKMLSLPVTDAEIVAYEEAHDDGWSFWDHNDRAVVVDSWVAAKCEQEAFRCDGPRESSVVVDGLVWRLCEACAEAVS